MLIMLRATHQPSHLVRCQIGYNLLGSAERVGDVRYGMRVHDALHHLTVHRQWHIYPTTLHHRWPMLPNGAGVIYRIMGMHSQQVKREVRNFCSLVRMTVKGRTLADDFPWR